MPRSSPAAEFAATTRWPVATSIPQNSCPNGLGSEPSSSGCPRRNVFRSVPSVSATSTCTSTSPGRRLGAGNVFEPQVAGAVEAQGLHGTKTTFSARPLR